MNNTSDANILGSSCAIQFLGQTRCRSLKMALRVAVLPLPNLCFQVADRPALTLGLGQDGGAERMGFVAFAVPRELMENPAPGA